MKNAKRNVIVSAILTIALCFSLMIGGTYAWFTDSAKVSVNKIVSGTLKVGLNMWDEENEKWVDADGKTLSFIRTDAEDEDNGLWAPGYKFRLPKLQVVNKGNLKLKFKLAFSFNGAEDTKLLEALSFTVKKGDVTEDLLAGGVIYENELLASFETKECEIFGEMKDVMNEYQNLEVRNLAVTLVAIQTNATEYPSTEAISTRIDMDITTPISANGKDGVVSASKGAKVTIDADIKAIESDGYAMAVWADGAGTVVTIKGGYFTQKLSSAGGANSHFDMIYASSGAQIIIEGGTFYAPSYNWTLNCKDGSNAKIIVKGGTFYKFDPSNNGVGDGEIEIAEGYHVERRTDNMDYYTVYSDDHIGEGYKKVVYGEGEYDYAIVKPLKNYDFKKAIMKDNNVVLLGGNYVGKLPTDYAFGANVIIDCGGYKLTYQDGTPIVSKEGLTVLHNGAVA